MMDDAREPALNPILGRLLAHFGFDRRFQRGEGARLYDQDGRCYLDLAAQYGALLMGHNPPLVRDEVAAALADREPALLQPYPAPHAEALAQALARLTGLTRCAFTTSGAETVEVALKLARAAAPEGRTVILSASGSYHGKTLGALAATGQRHYAEGFGPAPPGFDHVPFGDAAPLAARLRAGDVAAVLLEPIQGERGVILPPPGYLAQVRALCDQHGAPLILDEIQTGLGRTGALFACQHEGVQPDVLLLAKGLGGGLFPLGACLCRGALYTSTFALKHSATFANHNLACRVGLAVLRALTDGGLVAEAARKGALLQRRLRELAARHPRALAAVRGRGLLAALELRPPAPDAGFFLSYLAHQGLLAYAFAGAAAERGVLLLPALGGSGVLRVSPPLTISDEELQRALEVLAEVCALWSDGRADALARGVGATAARHRDADPRARVELPAAPPAPTAAPAPAVGRYAFLVHYTALEDIVTTDPTLQRLSADELRCFARFAAALPAGVVYQAPPLRSPLGRSAAGFIIALPLLPEHMLRLGRARVQEELRRAVALAAGLHATVVGLGGLTTPYSQRGAALRGQGPAITTGNTLTAIMAVAALEQALREAGRDLGEEQVAVVGARGSVGALAARLLARRRPRRLLLVCNPERGADGERGLAPLREELGAEAVALGSMADLRACGAVLSASSALHPVLDGAPLRSGAVICDVARPRDASPALRARPDLRVLDGGLVALPDPTARFGAGNLQGYPPGVQLPCLSETILLALAGERGDCGVGESIPLETADRIAALAAQHGFRLAPDPTDPTGPTDPRPST